MTPGERAAAQAALNEGRGVYGRLDQIRGPEDAAADILDLWRAAESAMRAMLGGSTLSGQPLVRELRQRGTLNLEQANALASFWDARDRVDDVGYKPTLTDVGYARVGYNELTRAVTEPSGTSATAAAAPAASAAAPSPYSGATIPPAPTPARPIAGAAPLATPRAVATPVATVRRRSPPPLLIGAVVLLLIVVGAAAYLMSGASSYSNDMDTAAGLLSSGRNEAARAAFNKIAREHPEESKPHVFLARFAREDGDLNTASQELSTAIRLDPTNELAQREMGLLLLSKNDPQLASKFLIRAVNLAPKDSAAQGYLGCAMLRLNSIEVGQRLISRAGTGSWSSCTALPPVTTPAPQ